MLHYIIIYVYSARCFSSASPKLICFVAYHPTRVRMGLVIVIASSRLNDFTFSRLNELTNQRLNIFLHPLLITHHPSPEFN